MSGQDITDCDWFISWDGCFARGFLLEQLQLNMGAGKSKQNSIEKQIHETSDEIFDPGKLLLEFSNLILDLAWPFARVFKREFFSIFARVHYSCDGLIYYFG